VGLPQSIAYMVAFSLWVSGGLRSLQEMDGGMVIVCDVGGLWCRWMRRGGAAIGGEACGRVYRGSRRRRLDADRRRRRRPLRNNYLHSTLPIVTKIIRATELF